MRGYFLDILENSQNLLEKKYVTKQGCHESGNGQEKKDLSRAGKYQRILFCVREN